MKGAQGLKFAVSDIRESEGLAADVELAPAEVQDPASGSKPAGPVSVHVEFSLGGNSILAQASIEGAWRVACSRCLAEHEAEFSADVDETYPLTQDSIDLTEDVRQAALLEIPQRSLCRPDCRGLCPRCGKNLNEGPCGCPAKAPSPFDALKKLKKD